MKFFSDRRGAVTPMIAICVAAIILLNFVMLDALRIKAIGDVTKRIQTLAVSSALSKFDRGLETRYGLYCMREDEKDALENRVRDIVSNNGIVNEIIDMLKSNGGLNFNIMDYDVKNIDLSLKSSIGDTEVLKQEILDLMKYKSVTNGVEKVVEKLEALLGGAKETETYAVENDFNTYFEIFNNKTAILDGEINGSNEVESYSVNGFLKIAWHENVDILKIYSSICAEALETLEEIIEIREEVGAFYNATLQKIENGELTASESLSDVMAKAKKNIVDYDVRAVHTKIYYNYTLLNETINLYEKYSEAQSEDEEIDIEATKSMMERLAYTDKNYKYVDFKRGISTETIAGALPNIEEKNLEEESKMFFDMCRNSIPENIFKDLPSKNVKSKNKSLAEIFENVYDVTDVVSGMIDSVKAEYEINDYVTTYFYDASEAKNFSDHYLMAEVEYIMFGNREDSSNLTAVYTELAAIRTILNMAHILRTPEKKKILDAAAAAMAAVTEGYGEPIYKGVLLVTWATSEATYDIKLLKEGKKVPLVKTDKDWALSIDGSFTLEEGERKENVTGMSYTDYVSILLCLVPESVKLARIQDLIELNLYKKTNKYTKIDELYTSAELKSDFSIKTFAIINKDGKHCYSWQQKACERY